jgi:branched-chain amino acid transport system ATP-binding protein
LIALARVLAMKPKILMLDEPAAGLSPVNVDNLISIILKIKEKFQLTLVIVEHILKVVMESCQRVTVLDHGEKIAAGTPADITTNEKVIEAYLGKKMDNKEIKKTLRS